MLAWKCIVAQYSIWSKIMWKQVPIVLVLLFLFSTLMFCLVAQASLDDKSLVLYLSFDEGKGDIAKDSSKHGHDGTLINNPKWVGGKFGKALEFDGNKETHVKVPITDALQLREKFSAAFWVKRGKTNTRLELYDWRRQLEVACYFPERYQKNLSLDPIGWRLGAKSHFG